VADSVICTENKAFHITDEDVYPRKFFHSFLRLNDISEMMERLIKYIVRRIVISFYSLIIFNMSKCKIFKMLRVHTLDNLHCGISGCGPAILHRHDNSRFIGCTAPSFTRSGTAKVRIIHLYGMIQFIERVTIFHGFSYFVDHQPGGFIINADQLFKSFGGTPPLVDTEQKNRPEPFFQRYMRSMKDRMGSYRGLMSTTDALKDLTSFRKIGFRMTAARTLKSIRSSELFQILKTVFFRLKAFLKLKKTDFIIDFHAYLQF